MIKEVLTSKHGFLRVNTMLTFLNSFYKVTCLEILYLVVPYIFRRTNDCLRNENLHEMEFNSQSDFEKCEEWCNSIPWCGGFTVASKSCYFKNLACRNNLVQAGLDVSPLFLKAGEFFMHQQGRTHNFS